VFKGHACIPISIFVVNAQKEIEELRYNLANISSTSDDGAKKLKEDYLQKLTVLEAQVSLHRHIPVNCNYSWFHILLCFAGCGVEEETRCSSSIIETKTKE
jgi:hypothetical protein